MRDRTLELFQIGDKTPRRRLTGIGNDIETRIAHFEPTRCVSGTCDPK
jgi:hypothetical protein